LPARADQSGYDYPPPVAPEAAKAPLTRELFRTRPLTPLYAAQYEALSPGMLAAFDAAVMPGRAAGETPEVWCDGFFADFANQSNIVHIEPAARSGRYADPVFKPWRDSCPTTSFNREYYGPLLGEFDYLPLPPIPDGNDVHDYTYTYGARNFRLFEADIDNDPGNGMETLFYSEGIYDHWEAVAMLKLRVEAPSSERDWNDVLPPEQIPNKLLSAEGRYQLLDQNDCDNKMVTPTGISTRRAFYPAGETYNGIIRYKGSVYIYQVHVTNFGGHWGYLALLTGLFRYGGKRYLVDPVCSATAPE
jgi:hypothetical protein